MNLTKRKVIVTGADGFIGSHLVEALVRKGCNVKAFTYYNSFNSWGWLENLPPDILSSVEVFSGDVRDPNGVRTAVAGQEVIFHLAALIGIPYSYHSPDSYLDTNIRGTLNILQAARDLNVEKTLVTSTSEVYGTALYAPIDEKHPRQGQSPYSATKIAADALSESFYRSFDLNVTTVRPFNTYGPRQSARAVIPTIITQLLAGEKEVSLGALTPTRDLVFVKDTAEGFIRLAECDGIAGQDVNICTGFEVSIKDLANLMIEKISPEARITSKEERLRPEKSEVNRLLGDVSLLKELTGWSPAITLSQGLDQTIDWFKNPGNRAGYKHDIYNV